MIHESLCDSKPEALAWPVRTHYTPLELCAAVTHTSVSVPCHYTCVTKISKGFFSLSLLPDILHHTLVQDSILRTKARHSLSQTDPKQHSVLGIPLHFKTIHSNVQYIYVYIYDKISNTRSVFFRWIQNWQLYFKIYRKTG